MSTSIINNRNSERILQDLISTMQAVHPGIGVSESSSIYILMQVFAFVSSLNVLTAESFSLASFLETAVGDDLTALAADRGVNRKPADKANVILEFSRAIIDEDNSYTVPASSSFSTIPDELGSSIVFKNYEAVTIEAGTDVVTALAECQTAGLLGNLDANVIVNFMTTVNGIDSVTNPASGYGGGDKESDIELRVRTRDLLANNNGRVTVTGYRQYLESLVGVKSAIVIPGSAMPNFITAIMTTGETENGIPTADQLLEWQNAINQDENRAVVDVITCIAPEEIIITVEATITEFTNEANPASTRSLVQQNIIDMINAIPAAGTVRSVDIESVIHDTAGVLDYDLIEPLSNTILTEFQKSSANISTVTIN